LSLLDEIRDISNIIKKSKLLVDIKAEVHDVVKKEGAKIISGNQGRRYSKNASEYDLVVVCNSNKSALSVSKKMRKSHPDMKVVELVDKIIGLKGDG
jgi:hypothetical protein